MHPKIWRITGFIGLVLILLLGISMAFQFDIPKPSGPYAVGRTHLTWVDPSRPEVQSSNSSDFRNVPVVIWYPADADQAGQGAYFPGLERIARSLASSGEVSFLEVFGLRYIKSNETVDAPFAANENTYPVVILSPGNGTNIEFYAGIADEIASNGYIVVGINHPFDVAAVELQDGSIAQFVPGPLEFQANEAWVTERIAVRAADALFVLNELGKLNESSHRLFAGHLDLTRVAIMGHSLGGITAAEACRTDTRFISCLNFDGIQRGGPFSTSENPTPPKQAFMLLTKEPNIHPKTISLLETIPSGSFLVVIHNASHDNFTDGPLLMPSLLPWPNQADRILALTRQYTVAFLDQTLKQQSNPILAAPLTSDEVSLDLFPPHS